MSKAMNQSEIFTRIGALAAAAVFCCATSFAQVGAQSSPSSPSNGSMNSPAQSQNSMQNGSMNQGSVGGSASDKMFIKKALQGSMAEVAAGKLALSKSSNDQVKQFAQKMIDDHSKMIEQAKPVAMQLGVQVPDGPAKKDKMEMAKLQALSGDAFDKAYIKAMVKDHKMDDSDFKSEETAAQSPQVKDLATQAEPIIASHLQMVQQIASSMNVGM